jgi:hypothetical protein
MNSNEAMLRRELAAANTKLEEISSVAVAAVKGPVLSVLEAVLALRDERDQLAVELDAAMARLSNVGVPHE